MTTRTMRLVGPDGCRKCKGTNVYGDQHGGWKCDTCGIYSSATEPTKAKIPKAIRRAVLSRDNATCLECGSTQSPCLDHIIPESKGGETTVENLRVLCRTCNSRKGNRA